MANKIMEFAKLLGLEPYDEFEIEGYRGEFRFTDSIFEVISDGKWVEANSILLGELVYGRSITRLPYHPKFGDKYWTLTGQDFGATVVSWGNCVVDYVRLKLGIVYRTKKEALANRDDIYQMLTGNGLEV